MNIVLIGYRGTGKSTIGKKLADKLWMDFADTDALITRQAGKSIKEIFAEVGESGFRELEVAAVMHASRLENTVIAAGGGVILRPENISNLKKSGKLVWLQAEPETLWQRIQADTATAASRPSLTASGGLEEIKTVLAERENLYRAAADSTLDVTKLDVEHAVYYLSQMV